MRSGRSTIAAILAAMAWLFAAVAYMTTALGVGHAEDNFNTTPKVLFFSKSSSYEHDVIKQTDKAPSLAEAILTEIGSIHGFDVVATKDGRVFDSDLTQYDAFFFFTTGNLMDAGNDKTPPMSAQGKEALLAAIRNGKRFLGITQLVGLERRTARSGRDSIDHGPGAHDDLANACAGALLSALNAHKRRVFYGAHGYGGGLITWWDAETGEEIDPATR